MLEPLGESPWAAGRSRVLVSHGDAGENREAVHPQPHVSLLQAECERLTVVALGSGHIARVEIEVAEAAPRGRTSAESVSASNLDATGEQLCGPLAVAKVPGSLSDAVQGAGDPQRVVEALIDRKRLLRLREVALRHAAETARPRLRCPSGALTGTASPLQPVQITVPAPHPKERSSHASQLTLILTQEHIADWRAVLHVVFPARSACYGKRVAVRHINGHVPC